MIHLCKSAVLKQKTSKDMQDSGPPKLDFETPIQTVPINQSNIQALRWSEVLSVLLLKIISISVIAALKHHQEEWDKNNT